MSTKTKQPRVQKFQSRKTNDAKRVRFGAGMAPVCLARGGNPATRDSGRVRFGAGMMPANLKK
jgi:hypothetical protein